MLESELVTRTENAIEEATARGFVSTAKALQQLLESFEEISCPAGAKKDKLLRCAVSLELFG